MGHTHKITGQERLGWSNKASTGREEKKKNEARLTGVNLLRFLGPSTCHLVSNYIKPPLLLFQEDY